jgi:hypothetical protein
MRPIVAQIAGSDKSVDAGSSSLLPRHEAERLDVVVIRRVAISRIMKLRCRRGFAMLLRRALVHCLFITMAMFVAFAPQAVRAEAMGIALEGFPYPYPVHFM